MRETLLPEHEAAFWEGVAEATRFFSGDADVQRALERLVCSLDEMGVPYAIVGRLPSTNGVIGARRRRSTSC